MSEAEWEYVARAGTTTAYHFGTTISQEQANYGEMNNGTVEVGQYDCNAFELCDIHGNVQEWVEDCWHDDYKGAPSDGSAWRVGCDSTEDFAGVDTRILRGGTWIDDRVDLRSAFRSGALHGCVTIKQDFVLLGRLPHNSLNLYLRDFR